MMRRLCTVIAALVLLVAAAPGPAQHAPAEARFIAYDLVLDAGHAGLAAYEIEITAAPGSPSIALVGVEGAPDGPYAAPPFYDPAALHADAFDRILLAAYVADAPAPTGATRVARLHLRVGGAGAPELAARLIAAGADEFTRIHPEIRLTPSAPLEGAR